jgi:hypothetical protein
MWRALLLLVLIGFSAVSVLALMQVGYLGLFTQQFSNWGTWQVLLDLFIAVSLCMVWMWRDAKQKGRNFWGWALLSLTTGSFGPLIYLLTEKESKRA